MAGGVSSVYFRSGALSLGDAARALSERGLSVTQDGERLHVRWDGGPELRVYLARYPWVRQEAAEAGEGTWHAEEMGQCDARFEISFDSLNEVLDEINTLIEVQATLQSLCRGYLCNSWNGNLAGPDE
jgi:hypothetical protein